MQAQIQTRTRLIDEAKAILARAKTAGRDVTDAEALTIETKLGQVERLTGEIRNAGADADSTRIERVASAAAAVKASASGLIETRLNLLDDPKGGFKSFGEFALAVRAARSMGEKQDSRLAAWRAAAPSTFGNTSSGADGGFLVPTEFSQQVRTLSMDAGAFLPMTDQIPVERNSISFPSDETTPWGGNGVRVFWQQEAAVATATKPLIKQNVLRMNKLIGLVPTTDELAADSTATSAFLSSRFARAVKWKVNDAIINGDGAGMPLGILNSPALVTIAKDSGQATATLSATNVQNMYGAMPVDYLDTAVWLITPDLMPKLVGLTLGNYGIWTPPQPGVYAPGGFLLGRPIIPTQTCQAFSTKGDIYFTSFAAYSTIAKPLDFAQSMHIDFDADSTLYRVTFRVDGQPTFKAPITQARGAQALSPYITLATR